MECRISASCHPPPTILKPPSASQMNAVGRPKTLFLSVPRWTLKLSTLSGNHILSATRPHGGSIAMLHSAC